MAKSDKKKRRVILRLIPDFVSLEELTKLLESYGAGETFTIEYVAPHLPEKMQNCAEDFGRAYLKFNKVEDVPEFKAHFEAESFVNPKNGHECKMQVEWAPYQHNFDVKPKKPDRKAGTVYDMDIYKRFQALKEREAENKLEREQSLQTDGASATDLFGDTGVGPVADKEENPVKSPIVAYLLAKHEKRKKDKLRERQRRRKKKREKELMLKKRLQEEAREEKEKRRREKKREQRERKKKLRSRKNEENENESGRRRESESESMKNSKIRSRRSRSKKALKKDEGKSDSKDSKESRSADPNGIPASVPNASSSSRGRRRKQRGRGSSSNRGARSRGSRGRGRKRGRGRGREETSV